MRPTVRWPHAGTWPAEHVFAARLRAARALCAARHDAHSANRSTSRGRLHVMHRPVLIRARLRTRRRRRAAARCRTHIDREWGARMPPQVRHASQNRRLARIPAWPARQCAIRSSFPRRQRGHVSLAGVRVRPHRTQRPSRRYWARVRPSPVIDHPPPVPPVFDVVSESRHCADTVDRTGDRRGPAADRTLCTCRPRAVLASAPAG